MSQTAVVVCIHNAPAAVARCLASIASATSKPDQLILVDDGSSQETADLLNAFMERSLLAVELRVHDQALGYTRSANAGLSLVKANMAVLLNSDTRVSAHWLDDLRRCAFSDEKIGLVGPLSNAASWQSVPCRFTARGEWLVNPLPVGWDVDDMAGLVRGLSQKAYPRVPLLNGFCLAIKSKFLEQISYLNEAAFPMGYGEENDLCLRAIKAGFQLAVADDAYVFHEKSSSFGHRRRRRLSRQGGRRLAKIHGAATIDRAVTELRDQPILAALRDRLAHYLDQYR